MTVNYILNKNKCVLTKNKVKNIAVQVIYQVYN